MERAMCILPTADNSVIEELPRAFVDPTPRVEPATAGTDALPVVLPVSENLLAPFAPGSDSPWLTISGVTNGVVSFAFAASPTNRTAHITLLGQLIAVTQIGSRLFPGHDQSPGRAGGGQ